MKAKLGTLGEIFIGLTYKPEDVADEGTIVLRSSNIQNGKLDFEDIVRVKSNIKDKLMVKDGDILMCSRNGSARLVGKTAMIKDLSEPMTFGAFMTIIRTNKNPYLQYYFKSDYFRRQLKGSTTTTINQITRNMLLDMEVPLLTESKSAEIVNRLRRIENIINKRKQELQALDDLIKSRFVELFGDPVTNPLGWEEHRLDEYIEFLTSGSRGWAQYFVDEENELFITIKNVKNNHITLDNIQYIDAPSNKEAERTKVKTGDLLISITADLGRTGVVDSNIAEKGAYINQHLSLVRLDKDRINPFYVSYFLETEGGKMQFDSKNQNGVKAGLNFEAIKSLKILVPPLEMQEAYLDFVEQTIKSKVVVQKALDEAQLLFDSLMQKYFG